MEAAGYEVTRQPFEYNYYEELAPAVVAGTSPGFPFTYTDGVNISTMDYSGSGTVSGVVQVVNDNIVPLPVGQPDSTSNAGCEDADFTGFTGDIALIQRGTCFFHEKIANAVEAGAEAVIIFNEGNSFERSGIDFGQATFPQDVPVIEMSAEAGPLLSSTSRRRQRRAVRSRSRSRRAPFQRCANRRTSSRRRRQAAPTASSCRARTSTR
jgi:PA domain